MATLDELQAQLAALTQRVNEITAPPDDYYTHRFSGEEIDNAVGRVADTPGSGAITAGDVGAAPSGFGLGGPAKLLTNADNLDDFFNVCGWYYWSSSIPLNVPPSSWGDMRYCFMLVSGDTQTVLSPYQKFQMMRVDFGGAQPWECINPPMKFGVEYRTIERYNGKPVYAKAISLGAGPEANTVKTVSHGLNSMQDIVDYGGSMNSGGTQPVSLPGMTPSGTDIRELGVNYANFLWKAGTSAITNYTGTGRVKYTKTTD